MTGNMEEVDGIIIHTLRSIGCDVEEDVESLLQFSTELIVEATVRCLKVINHATDLPQTLPPGMSARFRVGTGLATAVQELGYKGEIGYQTFLYSNEAEVRRVFMFLIEKLPKEASEAVEEVLGSSVLLQRAISAEVARRLASPWTPPYCKVNNICWRGKPPAWVQEGCHSVHGFSSTSLASPKGLGDLSKPVSKALKKYYQSDAGLVTSQPVHHRDLAASLLENNLADVTEQQEWETEWNHQGLASGLTEQEFRARKRQKIRKRVSDHLRQGVQKGEAAAGAKRSEDLMQLISAIGERASGTKGKGSRFTHAEKLQFTQDEDKVQQIGEGPRVDTEEELKQKREEEVDKLREELSELSTRLEKMDLEMRKYTAGSQQMEEEISRQGQTNIEKEEAYRVKKRTIDLLPDADNNIAKLQGLVDSSAQRLVSLANQWEKHRGPLIQRYRELKEANDGIVSESQKKLEEIKLLRERMKDVADDAKIKDELCKQLVSEYERMTKDVNRSAYTQRIMEIVANIKKQKQEIDKILIDTKYTQKEINQLSGKLDRTFTVTDELIFKDAKKDEAVRKAYKYLAALHENCETLIQTVETTGVIMREIRDLEDQIENEGQKKVLANLERITSDYQQMKKENAHLMAKYKKQQGE